MDGIKLINFNVFDNGSNGRLTPLEGGIDIPFEINRIYYITQVQKGVRRGFHSHKELQQVLICLHGSVKIMVKTPVAEQVIDLNSLTLGLYIGPMIWREMYDFSPEAVLLVLASRHYDESDYIRDYLEYNKFANKYFGLEE